MTTFILFYSTIAGNVRRKGKFEAKYTLRVHYILHNIIYYIFHLIYRYSTLFIDWMTFFFHLWLFSLTVFVIMFILLPVQFCWFLIITHFCQNLFLSQFFNIWSLFPPVLVFWTCMAFAVNQNLKLKCTRSLYMFVIDIAFSAFSFVYFWSSIS